MERVGQIVEDLFWKAMYGDVGEKARSQAQRVASNLLLKVDLVSPGPTPPPPDEVLKRLDAWSWMADRNRLGQALVGLSDRLPKCTALVNQAEMPEQAVGLASSASVACWKLFYGVRRGTMEHVFSSCAGAASG